MSYGGFRGGGHGGGGRVQKVMVQPINLIFRYLQNATKVQIWLYENNRVRLEGKIIGFDEYMNLVIDEAEEISVRVSSLNMVHWQGAAELLLAIARKDAKKLEELIVGGIADCDQRYPCGGVMKPVILICVERRLFELVEVLLNLGCSVNLGDSDGNSALHAAVRLADSSCVLLLLDHGADPNHVNFSGHGLVGVTPLHIAIDAGNIEIAKLLLSHGADPNKCDMNVGVHPLVRVCDANITVHFKRELLCLLKAAGGKCPKLSIQGVELNQLNCGGPMSLKQCCRAVIVKNTSFRNKVLPITPKSIRSFLSFEKRD
ncbi:unnamed protein product [Notodromas monacha]|uniref:Sm protein E n=1 Tax=Notodromas monacha TaxID=399045 RepID=A0A7R9BNN4_9CRUS|nr:unnamed protein product [Notodromas monacha]CAG0917476.1 unnamed protein product [Notodromas monacha]